METSPNARELIRAGNRLRFWLEGEPDAPLVALTHGVSLDHGTFSAQVPALLDAGYQVLTWDIRGHGASQPLVSGITVSVVADDLLAVLDAAGAERAVLCGQSFGGMVVQDLLARHPERVVGLVVIGAPSLAERPGAVMRVLQRLRIALASVWPDGNLRRLFVITVTRDPQVRVYVEQATAKVSRAAFIAVSRAAMEGYLGAAEVPKHDVPLLLVRGEKEESLVTRAIEAWAARDPAVRHAIVPGAGHLANQEAPESFNAVLLEFLDSLDLSRRARRNEAREQQQAVNPEWEGASDAGNL